MGRFYGKKIRDGAINAATGKAWAIADVPTRWRAATEAWLSTN